MSDTEPYVPNLTVSPSLLVPALVTILAIVLLAIGGKVPLAYNVRNLSARRVTTLLTALAFSLVIGLLTVMLAFVNGMDQLTRESGQPGNVMVLSEGATDEAFSNLGYSDTSDVELQPGVLRDQQDRPLASRETYMVVAQPLIDDPARRRFIQIRGIENPQISALVHGLELQSGDWFSDTGVVAVPRVDAPGEMEAVPEVVLGEAIAAQLAADQRRPTLVPGDLFELGPRRWYVAGVMRTARTIYGSEVWAKNALVAKTWGKNSYTTIVVRTLDRSAAMRLTADLKDHFTKAAIQPLTEAEYFEKVSNTNRQFLFGSMFVTMFIAFGGVMGVMNTMFAAISQRAKDIGVMRILGFARWQILVSFLLESLAIAIVGGALGCALGALCHGHQSTSVLSAAEGGGAKTIVLEMQVTANTVLIAALLTIAMGLIGGLIPAISAMRKRPLEALR